MDYKEKMISLVKEDHDGTIEHHQKHIFVVYGSDWHNEYRSLVETLKKLAWKYRAQQNNLVFAKYDIRYNEKEGLEFDH